MVVYRLTNLGTMLASNMRPVMKNERSQKRWAVIYYLARNGGVKDKESIIQNTGADGYTLSFLASRRIITGGEGVMV